LRPAAPEIAPLDGTESLAEIFDRRFFRLDSVREGRAPVPRIFLTNLPADIDRIEHAEPRKTFFMQAALPLVLLVNESILAERQRIRALWDKTLRGLVLSEKETLWLKAVARRYRSKPDRFEDLLKRVDIIPPALALAQGAAESGWGTSRPAREDNALFGQMTWTKGSVGPDGTQGEPVYIVQPFDDLLQCVQAYARNLNSHPAYAEFRERRAEMRTLGQIPDGYRLAITLDRYSERGWAYLAEVRLIIRSNRLTQLDRAWLDTPSSALLLVPGI
jgi:Bax protein